MLTWQRCIYLLPLFINWQLCFSLFELTIGWLIGWPMLLGKLLYNGLFVVFTVMVGHILGGWLDFWTTVPLPNRMCTKKQHFILSKHFLLHFDSLFVFLNSTVHNQSKKTQYTTPNSCLQSLIWLPGVCWAKLATYWSHNSKATSTPTCAVVMCTTQ